MLKLKNKILRKIIFILAAAMVSITFALPALAATAGTVCSSPGATDGNLTCGSCSSQGCVWTATDSNDACNDTTGSGGKVSQSKVSKCLNQSPIVKDIQTIVNFLSAAVGVIVIAMIIIGGIQYTMAGDNSSALEAARKRISNAIIALVAFIFAFAFIQWLIPGGIFG